MQSNDVIRSLQVASFSIDYCKPTSSFLGMNKCSGLNVNGYNNISAPVKGLR